MGETVFHINQWIGLPIFILLTLLPTIYIFYIRGGKEVERRWIQERYGSEFPLHPVKVRSIEEEDQFVASRQCPTCLCPFETESHGICFAEPPSKHDRSQKQRKLLADIQVICPRCGRKSTFYFDIDELEVVKRLGYTQNMVLAYMLEARRRGMGGSN